MRPMPGAAVVRSGRPTAIAALLSLCVAAGASAQDQAPGRSGWPCAGRPDPVYVRTSEATGGQLFMFHPSEVGDSGTLMAASFTHDDTLFRVAGPLEEGLQEYPVTIDPSVESVLFSVSIQCLQVVEIERPSGAPLQASDDRVDYHQFEAGRIIVLPHPEAGTWKIRASGRGLAFIVVQARTSTSLGQVQLLARKDDGAELAPVFQPGRPRSQQAVAVSVSADVRDVEARLVSARFQELGPIALAAAEQAAGAAWRGTFVVPAVPFRIVVSGTTADGHPFVRVHAPLFEPAR